MSKLAIFVAPVLYQSYQDTDWCGGYFENGKGKDVHHSEKTPNQRCRIESTPENQTILKQSIHL